MGTKMHWTMIVGICLIAVGTFLTYWGSTLQSNKVSDEIKEKIHDTNMKIEALNNNPGIEKNKIVEIDNEFNDWANKFIKNRDTIKIEQEKASVEFKTNEIELSKAWLPFYESFFYTLRDMLNAFNETSGTAIPFSIPTLPNNLFSAEAKKYVAKIKFSSSDVWIITLTVRKPFDKDAIPIIEISKKPGKYYDKKINVKGEMHYMGDFRIIPILDISKFAIEKDQNIFLTRGVNEIYDITKYEEHLKEITRCIIEDQLSKL